MSAAQIREHLIVHYSRVILHGGSEREWNRVQDWIKRLSRLTSLSREAVMAELATDARIFEADGIED